MQLLYEIAIALEIIKRIEREKSLMSHFEDVRGRLKFLVVLILIVDCYP